ncbi:MAG: transcription elongation factor GreA [Clostridia bacterium]|nr:transcription elongation factor GreA [Clostridia bacterium]
MSFQLTQKDYDKLKAELKNLYELDKLNIIAIKDAKDQGDLSENSEYDAAKAEEVKINQRIAELENQLKNAVIIDETILTTETVQLGLYVTILDKTYNETVTYQIVSSLVDDVLLKKLSDTSPIGKALLGKKVGDIVTFDGAKQKSEIEILAISKNKAE